MALGSLDWRGDLEDGRRRTLQRALLASAGAHVAAVIVLSISPSPSAFEMPQAMTVDLVAAVPMPAAAPPAAKPAPAPAPPKPAPPPPPPKPQVKILPKEAPAPAAKPEPIAKRPERPKELKLDDAMAKLRGEVGEDAPAVPEPTEVAEAAVPSAGTPRLGVPVPPEVAAWNLAVMRHIRANWMMPTEFRVSGLAAQLEIEVAVDGRVIGEPELVRSSGNPYFDDNAIRAVVRASPLPAAPSAGRRTLIFTSEE